MTGGSLIVHDKHLIEGVVLTVPQPGTTGQTFVQEVSSISIHNMTADIVRVEVVTNPIDIGNTFAFIGPGAALTFGDYPLGFITEVYITDTGTLSNGGGFIIVNSFFN